MGGSYEAHVTYPGAGSSDSRVKLEMLRNVAADTSER